MINGLVTGIGTGIMIRNEIVIEMNVFHIEHGIEFEILHHIFDRIGFDQIESAEIEQQWRRNEEDER